MTGKFPNGLKSALKKSGISQAELSRQTGIRPQNISRFIKGQRELTGLWAEKLAPPLKVTPASLVFAPKPTKPAQDANSIDEARIRKIMQEAFDMRGVEDPQSVVQTIVELSKGPLPVEDEEQFRDYYTARISRVLRQSDRRDREK